MNNSIKNLLSSSTISKTWKIVRDIAGVVLLISTFLTSSASPILLPPNVSVWLGAVSIVSAIITGRAQLDTSGAGKKVKIV